METLPRDILFVIFGFCGDYEIMQLAHTNMYLYRGVFAYLAEVKPSRIIPLSGNYLPQIKEMMLGRSINIQNGDMLRLRQKPTPILFYMIINAPHIEKIYNSAYGTHVSEKSNIELSNIFLKDYYAKELARVFNTPLRDLLFPTLLSMPEPPQKVLSAAIYKVNVKYRHFISERYIEPYIRGKRPKYNNVTMQKFIIAYKN